MNHELSFSKLTGLIALISCPIALLSISLVFAAYNWDAAIAFDPSQAIGYLPDPSATLRWAWILDILGYYLPLAPISIWLHHRLSARAPLHSQLFTYCALGFVAVGASGAAMLAGSTIPLFETFQSGDAVEKAVSAQIYSNLNNEVMNGIWNIFSMLLAAIWWLGVGWLFRADQNRLSILSTLVGLACAIDVAGYIFTLDFLSNLGLNFYLLGAPLWAAWMGWHILKNPLSPG